VPNEELLTFLSNTPLTSRNPKATSLMRGPTTIGPMVPPSLTHQENRGWPPRKGAQSSFGLKTANSDSFWGTLFRNKRMSNTSDFRNNLSLFGLQA
jgi:hypothetical protein